MNIEKIAFEQINNLVGDVEHESASRQSYAVLAVSSSDNNAKILAGLWPVVGKCVLLACHLTDQDHTKRTLQRALYCGRDFADNILNPPSTPIDARDERIKELEERLTITNAAVEDVDKLIAAFRSESKLLAAENSSLKKQIRTLKTQLTKATKLKQK